MIDQANAGTFANDNSAATIALVTNQTISAGAFIVVTFGWGDASITLTSVSGGGLTWTIDAQKGHSASAFNACALATAQAPSGLASGTTITGSMSGSPFERVAGAISFTGVATSSPLDGTPTTGQSSGSTTAYTTGNVSLSAGSVLVTVFYAEIGTSATASSGTKAFDSYTIDTAGLVTQYQIQASAGSYANAGSWGHASPWCFSSAAYLAAAGGGGGGAAIPDLRMDPYQGAY